MAITVYNTEGTGFNWKGCTATSVNSIQIAKPTATAAGEWLLAFVSSNQTFSTTWADVPSGFTRLALDESSITSSPKIAFFYKQADGTEPSTLTFSPTVAGSSFQPHAVTLLRVSGLDTAGPIDAFSRLLFHGSSVDGSTAAVTASQSGATILTFISFSDGRCVTDDKYPTGYTGVCVRSFTNLGPYNTHALAFKQNVSAGLEATATFSGVMTSAAFHNRVAIVLRAAAAAPLSLTSLDSDNIVYSLQADANLVGTGLSAGQTFTYKGVACTSISASSSTSIKLTLPNFFTNNIKLGTQNEFKVID